MCWGRGGQGRGAVFSFGGKAVLFIYVSSGLAAYADSSLDLWMGNTSSLLNNWG